MTFDVYKVHQGDFDVDYLGVVTACCEGAATATASDCWNVRPDDLDLQEIGDVILGEIVEALGCEECEWRIVAGEIATDAAGRA
jgi:hypothetical protein